MVDYLDIDDVKRCFPAPSYRIYQEKTLEAVVNILNKRRVCVLDGPVGSGKSYILMAIASAIDGGAFYVTPQNLLIEQLVTDKFLRGKLDNIKGRRHYVCGLPGEQLKGTTCDVAPCKCDKDYDCHLKYPKCPYWGQKMKAASHQVCVTNFSYLIAEGFIPDEASCPTLGSRSLLIVDEGHNIGEVANDFISCTISRRTVPAMFFEKIVYGLMSLSKSAKTIDDIKTYLASLNTKVIDEISILADGYMNKKQVKDYDRLIELNKKIESLVECDCEWVFQFEPDDRSDKKRGWVKLIMKPLKVDKYMQHLIWKRADRIIISSGTPPVYPGAMADIGLATRSRFERVDGKIKRVKGRSDHSVVHVPSVFPVANRPVIDRRSGYMTRKQEAATLPKAIDTIHHILDENSTFRGIIHANSYRHASLIRERLTLEHGDRLVFHSSDDRNDVLDKWLKGKYANNGTDNTVLVAVSMEEGLDLKDDLCRFQVLFKVMYPSLGDKRVAKRLELGEEDWYRNLTLIKVIQSYGRAVRGPDDWAKYYVVDSSFYRLVSSMKKYLPPWFVEAL